MPDGNRRRLRRVTDALNTRAANVPERFERQRLPRFLGPILDTPFAKVVEHLREPRRAAVACRSAQVAHDPAPRLADQLAALTGRHIRPDALERVGFADEPL